MIERDKVITLCYKCNEKISRKTEKEIIARTIIKALKEIKSK